MPEKTGTQMLEEAQKEVNKIWIDEMKYVVNEAIWKSWENVLKEYDKVYGAWPKEEKKDEK